MKRRAADFSHMKRSHPIILAFALTCGLWAQAGAQTAPVFSKPTLQAARIVAAPAVVRAGLPRGAKTLFCQRVQLEGVVVLLHGWQIGDNPRTTLDIFAPIAAPRFASRAGKRSRSKTPRRVNRAVLGDVQSQGVMGMSVRTTPFDTRAHRGSVLVVEWSSENASFSSSSEPMIVVTLPSGLRGQAFSDDCTTMSEPGGGERYLPARGTDGRFFLMHQSYDSNQNTSRFTPHTWNGKGYRAGVTGPEVPSP